MQYTKLTDNARQTKYLIETNFRRNKIWRISRVLVNFVEINLDKIISKLPIYQTGET